MGERELITSEQRKALDQGFELGFYEAVTRSEPDNVEALNALGHLYTGAGRFEDGLAVDRRLAELVPNEPIIRYNLACSLALTGDADAALEALEVAIRLGYNDPDHMVSDADLQSLRDLPRFRALVRKLRLGSAPPAAPGAKPPQLPGSGS